MIRSGNRNLNESREKTVLTMLQQEGCGIYVSVDTIHRRCLRTVLSLSVVFVKLHELTHERLNQFPWGLPSPVASDEGCDWSAPKSILAVTATFIFQLANCTQTALCGYFVLLWTDRSASMVSLL